MLSSYRIGDIIIQGVDDISLNNDILNDYPNTIGSDYILIKDKRDRIRCATMIVLNHIKKYFHLFPPDIGSSTVVHLRLGDAVGGNYFYEKYLRPLDVSYYKKNVPLSKVYVIGKCHFGKGDSSTNYDECIELSNTYMSNILSELNATHFDGGSPDADLCCAILAKNFVQGRGYYSQLIVEIRRCLGLKSIETYSHVFENMTVEEGSQVIIR
jgi:hypothetical protein